MSDGWRAAGRVRLWTAGVVEISTKNGCDDAHNEFTIYGGQRDTAQPSFELGACYVRIVGVNSHAGELVPNIIIYTAEPAHPVHRYDAGQSRDPLIVRLRQSPPDGSAVGDCETGTASAC